MQLVAKAIEFDGKKKSGWRSSPHAPFCGARPQYGGHASFLCDDLAEAAVRNAGQQKHRIVEIAFAATVGTGQHVHLLQGKTDLTHRSITGNRQFADHKSKST